MWRRQCSAPHTHTTTLNRTNAPLQAIHAADPTALVTVGSWNAKADTDVDGFRNYWSDQCLAKAAALPSKGLSLANGPRGMQGTGLDFYQIHTYPSNGGFDPESPYVGLQKSHYGLDKPLVIGEFPALPSNGGLTDTQLYDYAYVSTL